jgi:hypothetical protein
MRLNKNTYPAYIDLEKGNHGYLKIDQMFGQTILKTDKIFTEFLQSLVITYKQVNNRYYLTETFKDAITTATPKIIDGNKQLKDIPCDCGVIFTDKGFSVYLSNPTDKKLKLLCFGFTRDVLTTYGVIDNDDNFYGIACSLKDGKPYNDTIGLSAYLNSFLTTLYFIHNCEIEQRVVAPMQKFKNNGKHFNESKSDVTILDCRWFTELVRDTPFHVKGHLRWQAHGESRSKRKLIWIEDFEKNGYIRKPQSILK